MPRTRHTTATTPTVTGCLVRTEQLSKRYGETVAIRRCDLEVQAGEIHAIVGENGSGKSSLVKVLSGTVPFEAGQVFIDHVNVRDDRRRLGRHVATVYQEVLVVPGASLVDNVFMGHDSLLRGRMSRRRKREVVKELLERLANESVDVDSRAEDCSLRIQQWVVIARALVRERPVLIFDESTAALDADDTQRLAMELQKIKERGGAVILVTHRIQELRNIADRATVLRNGETVATVETTDLTERSLIELMSGKALADAAVENAHASGGAGAGVFKAEDLHVTSTSACTSLEVREGEIVGLVGLEGHGQKEVLEALSGHTRKLSGTIQVRQGGAWAPVHDSASAARLGVSYVTGDRKRDGIFPGMAVDLNFAMTTLGSDSVAGWWLRAGKRRERFAPYMKSLKIKMASPDRPIETLSGGNQQKVLIARALAEDPRVLLLNDPTRGVDLETKADLYTTIKDSAARGVGLVFVSTETEEYARVCDRLLVFRHGEIVAELPGDSTTSRVLDAMFGQSDQEGKGADVP